MLVQQALALLGMAAQLALGVYAFRRHERSAVARPLAMLCFLLAAWNAANWSHQWCDARNYEATSTWRILELTLSPWVAPLALHVVLAFVGRRRQLPWLLYATYVVFGLLSLSSAAAVFSEPALAWTESEAWSIYYLVPFVFVIGFCVVALAQHAQGAANDDERMRSWLMLVAIGFGGAMAMTELLDDLLASVVHTPALGVVGSLVATGLFAIVTLRLKLFGRELSSSAGLYSAGVGIIGLVAFLVVFHRLEANLALFVLGTLTVTGLLVAAMVPVIMRVVQRREQTRRLAGMGRFAEQMAHDIKNPLAALKGSVQFLAEERNQGRSIDDQREFLDLMVEQIDRVQTIVDRYHRLASCDPQLRLLRVNDVVQRVLALQPHAQAEGVQLASDLSTDDPECMADPDLLANAVENLVRNAAEAMPEGGTLTVRTSAITDRG
ncbi:MAG: histidine kinase dimerization/phospho-acceptor domain-containing protein, partial [Planctomycetota bacterium]|nr:histidine kinase dimerization/phospho-acceptor domain-containing protein [Planctomycetota bacterium]